MNNIEKITRLNVELEGLLHVLAHRDSSAIREMLADKYSNFTQAFEELLEEMRNNPLEENAETLHHVDEELTADEVKEQEAVEPEVEDETDAAAEAIERGEKADAEVPFESEAEAEPEPDAEPEEQADSEEESPDEPVEEEDDKSLFMDDEEDVFDRTPEPADHETVRYAEPEVSSELSVDEMLSRREATDLRRVFTLNDKFRFRRALFAQNDALFAEALEQLSELPTFADACSFVESQYGWSMSNPDVEDFLSIIKPHYAK